MSSPPPVGGLHELPNKSDWFTDIALANPNVHTLNVQTARLRTTTGRELLPHGCESPFPVSPTHPCRHSPLGVEAVGKAEIGETREFRAGLSSRAIER